MEFVLAVALLVLVLGISSAALPFVAFRKRRPIRRRPV